MNISLLILDGLLVVIFLAGWIESTAFSTYKWTWWRFLRALSLPLAIGVALHYIVNASWWETPSPSLLKWLDNYINLVMLVGGAAWFAFIIFFPILVIDLTGFVVAQFTGSSKVFALTMGDGDIVLAIPAPDKDEDDADKSATKSKYDEWIYKP